MSTESRAIRLFRPNLAKFTKELDSVYKAAQSLTDESWVWSSESALDIAQSPLQKTIPGADPRPLALKFAPKEIAKSGSAYARWSILTAALSFQQKAPEDFLKRLKSWWGEGAHPKNEIPTSEAGWDAVFGVGDENRAAHITIFTELLTSRNFQIVANGWEEKVASGRVFNISDAVRLGKAFPKSFADPFLFKAQRAIWQFTLPFIQLGQNISVELTGATDPSLVFWMEEAGLAHIHESIHAKISTEGLIRDEVQEKVIRAFLAQNQSGLDFAVPGHPYEWRARKFKSETTDY